ncbi:hypothetical protein TUM4261_41120 [Shewanella sp. c952]|uniref:hypothetical protein n=1 Tax=Shewanella sp. c952 TaxID=2815913 RepID=UPI001BBE0AC1|nr:hypothetical protein [Shewanella sp. c952]GIU19302.1 hypothetical protein TUM4261_41120 [Shewanella sp. c952]
MFKSSLACNSNFNYSITTALLISLTLVACGSSDDDPEPETLPQPVPVTVTPDTGVFLDSAVIGIGYRTETLSGTTDVEGKYQYLAGETVTFFIGGLEFPATAATGIVTPLNIAATDDVTNTAVINMARLLQTLDQDGDPSNGISITQTAIDSAEPVDFSMSTTEFAASAAVQATIENGGQDTAVSELIDTETALEHLSEELEKQDIQMGIIGSWNATDDDNDLLSIIFIDSSTYVIFEVDSDDDYEDSGMEWGTYQRDSETHRVTAVQEFDDNENVGLNDLTTDTGAPELFATVTNEELRITVDDDADGTIDETLNFAALNSSNELGAWIIHDIDGEAYENGLLMFIFYADGTYVQAGVDANEAEEESGMEWGTYSINTDTNRVTVSQTFDGNAEAGLNDFATDSSLGLYLTVVDDVLTLSVDENGDGEIEENLNFIRP